MILQLLTLDITTSSVVTLSADTNNVYDVSTEAHFQLPEIHSDTLLVIENLKSGTFATLTHGKQTTLAASWLGQSGYYLINIPSSWKSDYTLSIQPFNDYANNDIKIQVLNLENFTEEFKKAVSLFIDANNLRLNIFNGNAETKLNITALEKFTKAHEGFIKTNHPLFAGFSSFERAQTLNSLNRRADAIKEYDVALYFLKKSGSAKSIDSILNYKGLALWRTQRLQEALAIFSELEQKYESSDNVELWTAFNNNRGLVLWQMGHMQEALENFNQYLSKKNLEYISKISMQDIDSLVQSEDLAYELYESMQIISNLSSVYDALGDAKKSEILKNLHLKLARKNNDMIEAAIAENNLSTLYISRSQFDKARLLLTDAVDIFTQKDDKGWLSLAEFNLGKVYQKLGLIKLAEIQYNKVLKLVDKKNNPRRVLQTQQKLLEIYLKKAEFEKNKSLSSKVLKLAQEVNYTKVISTAHLNNYQLFLKENKLLQAEKEITQAISIAENKTYKRFQSKLIIELARLKYLQNDANASIRILQKEVKELQQIWETNYMNTANNLLALSYIKLNDYTSAKRTILNEISNLNFYINSAESRKTFLKLGDMLKESLSIFNLISYKQEQPIDGFIKNNSLLNRFNLLKVRGYDSRSQISNDSTDTDAISDLLIEIKNKSDALENPKLSEADRKKMQNDIVQMKAKLDFSFSAPHKQTIPDTDLAQLQSKLDNETLLIQFSIGEAGGVSWWITRDSFNSFEHSGKQELAKLVNDMRQEITNNPGNFDATKKLSKLLLLPLNQYQNIKNIKLILDSPLNLIPFAALADPRENYKKSLSDTTGIQRVYSVYSLFRKITASDSQLDALIIADPITSADDSRLKNLNTSQPTITSYPRLMGSQIEARNIEKIINSDSLVGFDANKAQFIKSEYKDKKILHFATHAFLHSEVSGLSSLILSAYDNQGNIRPSSFLRANEIESLTLNNYLIVLSGCETGVEIDNNGLGLDGLTTSFITAGAHNLIASLWQVDDKVTAKLMTEFYRNLSQGHSISESLNNAQHAIKSSVRTRNPKYWAGWFLLSNEI